MSDSVRLERIGDVARLTLARPNVLNAIDANVCRALCVYLDELEGDGRTRVVILDGAGEKAFSAGADLTYMRGLEGAPLRRFIEQTWIAFERLSQSPLPSIAVLHGYVLGGGLELALACDFRVADETVQIGLPEMGLGSVPGSGAMQRLPELIGKSKTLELALCGGRMDAAWAKEVGLVNRSVPAGQGLSSALKWAATICECGPDAVRYAKVAMRSRGDPVVARALHGLISDSCHTDQAYQQKTERFSA